MTEFLLAGFDPYLVPYLDGWELQRQTHRAVLSGHNPGTVILLEHTPVFTAGSRTSPDERPTDGTPVIDVDRGGKITWHGPGQLTGYPIIRLPEPVDVRAYVDRIEEMIIDALAPFGIAGERVPGRSGVWVHRGHGHDKVAAVGVRVAGGVTMHGFALNCCNSLEPFSQIIPCGIRDAGVTSVSELIGRRVTPADISERVTESFIRHVEFVTV